MTSTIRILLGAPLRGTEAAFLRRLTDTLEGLEALVVAGFEVDGRQIDFVVVTATYVALVEHKAIDGAIRGGRNGRWWVRDRAGRRVPYEGENPYVQAREAKFALSDGMLAFRRSSGAPPPSDDRFFKDFDALVVVSPAIADGSEIDASDVKVRVISEQDFFAEIRSRRTRGTWSLDHWRRFALSYGGLVEVSLAEVLDPAIRRAGELVFGYNHALAALLDASLAPLLPAELGAHYGAPLVADLSTRSSALLVAPSGWAKTFHLHHLAVAAARGDREVPMLVEARLVDGGDLSKALAVGTAPFSKASSHEIAAAAVAIGRTPLLICDGLNESSVEPAVLARAIAAFVTEFGARVVLASQTVDGAFGALVERHLEVAPLELAHKRIVYAHHAGIEPSERLDHLAGGFANAYDLTIAGRCHDLLTGPTNLAALYDTYTRRLAGAQQAEVLALLRHVAWEMHANGSFVLGRSRFDALAERFCAREGVRLSTLDELRRSRLVRLDDDRFAFEHDRLLAYFAAEELGRRFAVPELATELARPINDELLEMVLPRYESAADVARLVASSQSVDFLLEALAGRHGAAARRAVRDLSEALVAAAVDDLANVEISCEAERRPDGTPTRLEVDLVGHRRWSEFDGRLAAVVALSLEPLSFGPLFLDLLDLTELRLAAAAERAAAANGLSPRVVWDAVTWRYAGRLSHATMALPLATMLANMHMFAMVVRPRRPLPIRDALLARVERDARARLAFYALLDDLRYTDNPPDIDLRLRTARMAWETGVYHLRLLAVEVLQFMAGYVGEHEPHRAGEIVETLEGFLTYDGVILNSAVFDALAGYSAVEPLSSVEAVELEARNIVAPGAARSEFVRALETADGRRPRETLFDLATGFLSAIFEELDCGVHFEVYRGLSSRERSRLLRLAARSEHQLTLDWVLSELLAEDDRYALPLFRRFASRPPEDSCFLQRSVAAHVVALAGCARRLAASPVSLASDTPGDRAWALVGEALFWMFRGDAEAARPVFSRFDHPATLALPDVLHHVMWAFANHRDLPHVDLATAFAAEVRPLLVHCLERVDDLAPSVRTRFVVDHRVRGFLIAKLAEIANEGTATKLRGLVDHPELGPTAVEAVRRIGRSARRGREKA